ncbi:hypothetical protein BN970_01241 [Mycolicibacterium conceptionense]|uniref:Uncharacterized protein n=1 Tax=Mycolicibacterium conceptionense TaxID=451644 RepID=A0A0U1D240_9MYCO|nr:hypothetical protein BN970_01241 [Mycolicibacterium conceptionense]
MPAVHDCKRFGQQAFSGQRELIASDHVVEGQDAGEQTGQQQHVDDVAPQPAQVVVRGVQQHVGVTVEGTLGYLRDLVGADRHDEGPAGHCVEAADQQHRGVGGPRDGALGIASLVTEDRRGFEADESGEREQHRDAEHAVGEYRRCEGSQAEPGWPGVGHDHQVQQDHDADFADEGDAEHFGAEFDVPVAQQCDDCQSGQRVDRPWYFRTAVEPHRVTDGPADVSVDAHLDRGVGDQATAAMPLPRRGPSPSVT